jgi:hypothetical protein
MKLRSKGICILAGAGPGDIGLVTLRTKEAAEKAQVIVLAVRWQPSPALIPAKLTHGPALKRVTTPNGKNAELGIFTISNRNPSLCPHAKLKSHNSMLLSSGSVGVPLSSG